MLERKDANNMGLDVKYVHGTYLNECDIIWEWENYKKAGERKRFMKAIDLLFGALPILEKSKSKNPDVIFAREELQEFCYRIKELVNEDLIITIINALYSLGLWSDDALGWAAVLKNFHEYEFKEEA